MKGRSWSTFNLSNKGALMLYPLMSKSLRSMGEIVPFGERPPPRLELMAQIRMMWTSLISGEPLRERKGKGPNGYEASLFRHSSAYSCPYSFLREFVKMGESRLRHFESHQVFGFVFFPLLAETACSRGRTYKWLTKEQVG